MNAVCERFLGASGARAAGVEQELAEHWDVDFLFGSWVEDPLVDSALAAQRTIDEEAWK